MCVWEGEGGVREDSTAASIYPGYRQAMHVGLCRNVTFFDTQNNMHRLDFSCFFLVSFIIIFYLMFLTLFLFFSFLLFILFYFIFDPILSREGHS